MLRNLLPVTVLCQLLCFALLALSQKLDGPIQTLLSIDGTLFENLTLRPNGQILATAVFPTSAVYLIDPAGSFPPTIIANLSDTSGTYGIQEGGNDVYYVLAGNTSLTTASAVPDSFYLFSIDMCNIQISASGEIVAAPEIVQVASLAAMTLPNGMTRSGGSLFIADSVQGAVYAVKISHHHSSTRNLQPRRVIQDPTMLGNMNSPSFGKFGINGLRAHHNVLYYCNSGFRKLYSLELASNYSAASSAKLIAQNCSCDDFAISPFGTELFVASPEDVIIIVDIATGEQSILAGQFGEGVDSDIPGASSAQFGLWPEPGTNRTVWPLYVTTNAGGDPHAKSGSQGVRELHVSF